MVNLIDSIVEGWVDVIIFLLVIIIGFVVSNVSFFVGFIVVLNGVDTIVDGWVELIIFLLVVVIGLLLLLEWIQLLRVELI